MGWGWEVLLRIMGGHTKHMSLPKVQVSYDTLIWVLDSKDHCDHFPLCQSVLAQCWPGFGAPRHLSPGPSPPASAAENHHPNSALSHVGDTEGQNERLESWAYFL